MSKGVDISLQSLTRTRSCDSTLGRIELAFWTTSRELIVSQPTSPHGIKPTSENRDLSAVQLLRLPVMPTERLIVRRFAMRDFADG
jgi:hypothetical protein